MGSFVGHITWHTLDIKSGIRTDGERDIRLEDVEITVNERTRRDEVLMTEAMDLFDPHKPADMGDPAVFAQLMSKMEDVMKQEGLDEVVERSYIKSICLDDQFEFGYAEHPSEERVGFGLVAGRTGEKTFSWYWFNVLELGRAVKLQEDGRLRFREAQTACGIEIVYCEFESDVSLRILPLDSPPDVEPLWRVVIHQGSQVYWPSLVEGQVVANGFVS